MTQEEYIGFNSINNLKSILSKNSPKSIFLVRVRDSYNICGAKDAMENNLKGYKVTQYYDFETNPKIEDVKKGIPLYKENDCDFIIAIGGGSTIDMAKSIAILSANSGDPEDYIYKRKEIKNKGNPLVAIPTTSGTGSESTKFSIVWVGKTKCSLEHEFVRPDYAIIDPQFTLSLPRYITACTGFDALCQAIESYWCVNSTEESKRYAREAIKLIMGNFHDAANKPTKESREAMAIAAHLAGKAINISKTTACHSISYPITSYFNVPHGHASGLTLGQMLVFNSQVLDDDILDKRGVPYVKSIIRDILNLIGAESADEASKKITRLMQEIGLSTKLSELGIKTETDREIVIQNGFHPDRVNNNPRKLTEEALREILNEIR